MIDLLNIIFEDRNLLSLIDLFYWTQDYPFISVLNAQQVRLVEEILKATLYLQLIHLIYLHRCLT